MLCTCHSAATIYKRRKLCRHYIIPDVERLFVDIQVLIKLFIKSVITCEDPKIVGALTKTQEKNVMDIFINNRIF